MNLAEIYSSANTLRQITWFYSPPPLSLSLSLSLLLVSYCLHPIRIDISPSGHTITLRTDKLGTPSPC